MTTFDFEDGPIPAPRPVARSAHLRRPAGRARVNVMDNHTTPKRERASRAPHYGPLLFNADGSVSQLVSSKANGDAWITVSVDDLDLLITGPAWNVGRAGNKRDAAGRPYLMVTRNQPKPSGGRRKERLARLVLERVLGRSLAGGKGTTEQADHIVQDPTDNRRSNLRLVGNRANQANRRDQVRVPAGISWVRRDQRWRVGVYDASGVYRPGDQPYFLDPRDAHFAAQRLRLRYGLQLLELTQEQQVWLYSGNWSAEQSPRR